MLSLPEPTSSGYSSPNRLKGVFRHCLFCEDSFYSPKWLSEKGGGLYCSKQCYWKNKHDAPWNKGLKGTHFSISTEFKKRPSLFQGTLKEYKSLHGWVYKVKGEPKVCTQCPTVNDLQWANKSQQYLREEEDWVSLCRRCHFYYDKQDERIRA